MKCLSLFFFWGGGRGVDRTIDMESSRSSTKGSGGVSFRFDVRGACLGVDNHAAVKSLLTLDVICQKLWAVIATHPLYIITHDFCPFCDCQ